MENPKLFKLLSRQEIRPLLKAGNRAELLDSLAQLIAELINNNNASFETAVSDLNEKSSYYFALMGETFKLISVRLKDTYGLEVDIEQLLKQARDNLDKVWPQLKKEAADQLYVTRTINGIFKRKE